MKKVFRALLPALVSVTFTILMCLGYAVMVDTTPKTAAELPEPNGQTDVKTSQS